MATRTGNHGLDTNGWTPIDQLVDTWTNQLGHPLDEPDSTIAD